MAVSSERPDHGHHRPPCHGSARGVWSLRRVGVAAVLVLLAISLAWWSAPIAAGSDPGGGTTSPASGPAQDGSRLADGGAAEAAAGVAALPLLTALALVLAAVPAITLAVQRRREQGPVTAAASDRSPEVDQPFVPPRAAVGATTSGPEPDTAAGPAPVRTDSLAGRAMRGIAGVFAYQGVVNIVQLVSSLVLARAIAPEQYGAFAVGLTIAGLGRYIGDCGAGSALIQQPGREPDKEDLGRALAIQLTVTGLMAAVLVLGAPWLTALFGAPTDTSWVISLLAITLVLEAPTVVVVVRLRRRGEYARLQVLSLGSVLVLYGVQIGALLAGFGLVGLVVSQIAGALALLVGMVLFGGGLVRPVASGALALARRGIAYQGSLIVHAVLSVGSVAVVGSQVTQSELGLWSWSTVLATPLMALVHGLQVVIFPSLSRYYERDGRRHEEAVALLARMQLLLVSTAVGLLAGFAVPIIALIFEERWLGAVGAARTSLAGVLPLVLAALLASTVQSTGRPGLRLRAMLISTGIGALAALPLAALAGATGAAFAIYLLVPLVDFVLLWWSFRVRLGRAFVNVLAGGASLLIALPLAAQVDSIPELVIRGLAAGLVSLLLLPLFDPKGVRLLWQLLRQRGRAQT